MDQTPGNEGKPSKKHKGVGRVSFLAHLQPIKKMVEEGWPYTAIYEKYQDQLGMSYIQFTRYIGQYITGASEAKPKVAISKETDISKQEETPVISSSKGVIRLNDAQPLPDSELF